MKLHRVLALVNRHLMLYKCSPQRIMEIIYWPLLDSPDLGLPHHLAAGKPDGLLLFWPEGRPAVDVAVRPALRGPPRWPRAPDRWRIRGAGSTYTCIGGDGVGGSHPTGSASLMHRLDNAAGGRSKHREQGNAPGQGDLSLRSDPVRRASESTSGRGACSSVMEASLGSPVACFRTADIVPDP